MPPPCCFLEINADNAREPIGRLLRMQYATARGVAHGLTSKTSATRIASAEHVGHIESVPQRPVVGMETSIGRLRLLAGPMQRKFPVLRTTNPPFL